MYVHRKSLVICLFVCFFYMYLLQGCLQIFTKHRKSLTLTSNLHVHSGISLLSPGVVFCTWSLMLNNVCIVSLCITATCTYRRESIFFSKRRGAGLKTKSSCWGPFLLYEFFYHVMWEGGWGGNFVTSLWTRSIKLLN